MEKFTKIISRNPLFFAILFPALIDGIVTILGQDASYWASQTVNEASPAYYVLSVAPWLFLLGSIVWFVLWYCVFIKLKEPFNLFWVFLFIAAHSWGSASWIMKMMKQANFYAIGDQFSIMFAWSLLIIYFSIVALIATFCLRIYMENRKQ